MASQAKPPPQCSSGHREGWKEVWVRSIEEQCFACLTPEITRLTHYMAPMVTHNSLLSLPISQHCLTCLLLRLTVHGWLWAIMANLCCHVLQGFQFLLWYQVELIDEVVKVFVAGIYMCFLLGEERMRWIKVTNNLAKFKPETKSKQKGK